MTRAAAYRQFNGAILVVDRGRQVYQRAFDEADMEWRIPNTVDTRFEIASASVWLPCTCTVAIMRRRLEGRHEALHRGGDESS